MLINKPKMPPHVFFISYTGKFPNLCGGLLRLHMEGQTVAFGSPALHKDAQYEQFWEADNGQWLIDVAKIPEKFQKYAEEIDEIFKTNIERPHCGGCR